MPMYAHAVIKGVKSIKAYFMNRFRNTSIHKLVCGNVLFIDRPL